MENKYLKKKKKKLKEFNWKKGERYVEKEKQEKTKKGFLVLKKKKKIDRLLMEWRLRKN